MLFSIAVNQFPKIYGYFFLKHAQFNISKYLIM